MTEFVFDLMDRMGAVGVGLLIFLENVIPPIPSEVILPLAGSRAAAGTMNFAAVWFAATCGSVAGALVLYGIGAIVGYDRLHVLAGKRWFVFTSQKDLDRGGQLMERHGTWVVLFTRFVPLLRSVVSIPAGIVRMPIWRFSLLTALGSGIWNLVFIYIGMQLGDNWGVVEQYLGPASYVVVGILLIVLIWLIWRRYNSAQGRAAASRDPFNR